MRILLGLVFALTLAPLARADDWPQWMGPNRDGVWAESGILDKFPDGGLKKLWSVPINGGFAGPAVAGGKVYVTDRVLGTGVKNPDDPFDTNTKVGGAERVLCFDAKTGEQVWKYDYLVAYQVSYGTGPRCTPTVSGGKVYSLGAMGDLVCLTADKGELVWKKDFKADYKAKTPTWGFCGHPLVYDNLLIALVGGENALVVAFEKDTGKEVWKALSPASAGAAGYAPPTILKFDGVDQLVQYHPTAVTALEPKTGKKLWSIKTDPGQYGMSIMGPRQSGSTLFAASEEASVAFTVTGGAEAKELWRGKKGEGLNPANMTPFVEGETIYGVDEGGMLRAVDLKTGKRLWYTFEPVIDAEREEDFKGAQFGTAFLVKNGDRFFIFNEKGSLVIAKLSREKCEVLSRASLVAPTGATFGRKVVWSHPAFAEKCVFVRNDKEVACFSLAK
jgi:outer membrane protein assembly factor BamB